MRTLISTKNKEEIGEIGLYGKFEEIKSISRINVSK